MDIIFYHGLCPDGWCSAYIASKRYPEAELAPLNHGIKGNELVAKVAGKDVLMLDFSLRTREENDMLAWASKSFRILDHHKTAQAVLEGAPYATFDMKRSGAGLAWDYLFGKDSIEASWDSLHYQPRPWYVEYTEVRDLWQWERYADALEVCAYLGTLPFEFEAWERLDNMSTNTARGLGAGALAHINHYVREAVQQAQSGVLQGYKTAVLNVPYLNCSEVGNELAKTHDVSLTYFERGDGMIQFSLRSIGDIDVSAIAKVFGGGGHKNASGFQKPYQKGRKLIDQILGRDIEYMKTELDILAMTLNKKAVRSGGGCL